MLQFFVALDCSFVRSFGFRMEVRSFIIADVGHKFSQVRRGGDDDDDVAVITFSTSNFH